MSKKIKPDSFRKQIASELRLLGGVLNRNVSDVCFDTGPITQAANMCGISKPYGPESWGYQVDDLRFRVKTPQKVIPSTVGDYLHVMMNFKIQGKCSSDLTDLIKLLEFSIVVTNEDKSYLSSWHFDKHLVSDDGGDGDPEDAHPLYHFQYGGKNLGPLGGNHGGILIMPSPRIGHPPMDVVLAIDFVLSNFAGIHWKGLREQPDYRTRLVEAQGKYLRPYVESMLSWWNTGRESDFVKSLWPHLI
ncbi:hypothetical protein [Pseudomonas sp. Marseille-Q5115]|uniref:hypothetical protein n=1 Tax=Pseudomonas sp. Marseille-Q5115 TaxID=2866593 RepID=UPI001CE49456|nr:hypothetical protein [Pseudomonas sp. Marseille-Q5115]